MSTRALTDVDDVPLLVDHDVAVVAVLDAEQVGDEGVGGQALGEVALRRLELLLSRQTDRCARLISILRYKRKAWLTQSAHLGVLRAVGHLEVSEQRAGVVLALLERVDRDGVRHKLSKAADHEQGRIRASRAIVTQLLCDRRRVMEFRRAWRWDLRR
jgi:hypothetical protein